MSQFIDAIKILDGKAKRLAYHQQRAIAALKAFYPDVRCFNIEDFIQNYNLPRNGLFKLRIEYTDKITTHSLIPYEKKDIKSLKTVYINTPSHTFKLANRDVFNQALSHKENCDDVLLIRDGLITDTSYANIALYTNGTWFTPLNPIIFGVNRQSLIDKNLIVPKDISIDTIYNYEKIAIFNAMIEFEDCVLSTKQIF